MCARCVSIVGQNFNVCDDHIVTIVFMAILHSQRGGRCIRHKYQGVDVKKEVHNFQEKNYFFFVLIFFGFFFRSKACAISSVYNMDGMLSIERGCIFF
jgi:hypothetical protein